MHFLAVVATWRGAHNDENLELTAWDDKSWEILRVYDFSMSTLYASGTYTGDATKDGTLTCKMTHEIDLSTGALKEITPAEFNCTISGKTLMVPAAIFGYEAPEGMEIPPLDFIRK